MNETPKPALINLCFSGEGRCRGVEASERLGMGSHQALTEAVRLDLSLAVMDMPTVSGFRAKEDAGHSPMRLPLFAAVI